MINKCIFTGVLTSNPELMQTKNGIPYSRLMIACNRNYRNRATRELESDYPSFVAYRKAAERASEFKQGDLIEIVSHFETPEKAEDIVNNRRGYFIVDYLRLLKKSDFKIPDFVEKDEDRSIQEVTSAPKDLPF